MGEGRDSTLASTLAELLILLQITWPSKAGQLSRINKLLLYSTGDYIQYSVINCNEKEYAKECVHIYVCVCVCVCVCIIYMRVYIYVCIITETLCCKQKLTHYTSIK